MIPQGVTPQRVLDAIAVCEPRPIATVEVLERALRYSMSRADLCDRIRELVGLGLVTAHAYTTPGGETEYGYELTCDGRIEQLGEAS